MSISLKLLMHLAGKCAYTIDEIARSFEMSSRSVFRYLKKIEEAGFVVEKRSGKYKLATNSPNYKNLQRLIYFSEEEAYIFYRAVSEIEGGTPIANRLKKKLISLYNFAALQQGDYQAETIKVQTITGAMKKQKRLKFIQYRSSHSGEISDRIVEAFDFFDNYQSVWCFDCQDKSVKQFKLSRLARIEAMEESWFFTAKHKEPFVDGFRMSGPNPIAIVELQLSLKAYNLLKEEFPLTEKNITKIDDNSYHLKIPIADYHGIGRFVMGLPGDIVNIAPEEFKVFIKEKMKLLNY